jgi:hypothetical protein
MESSLAALSMDPEGEPESRPKQPSLEQIAKRERFIGCVKGREEYKMYRFMDREGAKVATPKADRGSKRDWEARAHVWRTAMRQVYLMWR